MTIDISKSKQTKTVFKVQSNGNLELRINRTDHSNKAKKKTPYVESVKPISESKNSAADSTTDWTDGKNDERKRYRVLPNGVVMKLMKKSDYKGFERMLTNISLIVGNAFLIKNLDILNNLTNVQTVAAFLPLYMFYGFQLQCMGFAGGHEVSTSICAIASTDTLCHMYSHLYSYSRLIAYSLQCIQNQGLQLFLCISRGSMLL